jgi:CubicO group peptidase (beta-lactamase class C family)
MKHIILSIFSLFLLIPTFAQDSLAIEKSKLLIQEFFDANNLAGLSVTVARKGEIIWSQGYGYSDLENKVPVDPATSKFRIGSVSKPFTAAAMAVLYEQDKILFDVPIQTYVPSFPKKRNKDKVTLRLLAGHLAGIRHYKKNEFLSSKKYETVLEGVKIFKDDSLLHKPGSRYAYSSYGWNLISAAMESAAEEEFLAFVQRVVFDSLGMENTTADHIEQIIPGRTRYYIKDKKGNHVNAPFVDNSYKWAGGGFLSTTEDMMKFGQAHLKEGYLKKETLELFFKSQKTTSGEVTDYGMGWATYHPDNGRTYYGHSGGSVGGTTAFMFDPEQEIIIAIVSNMSSVRYGKVPVELLDYFLD